MTLVRGYKAFDANFQCRGYQFRVGETFSIEGYLEMCWRGFHFCKSPVSVARYYDWINDPTMRFAEIEAVGKIKTVNDKSVTDGIRIVREISRKKFRKLCTGHFKILNCEAWYKDGRLHRDDGPAWISPADEQWFEHGRLYRVRTKPIHKAEIPTSREKLYICVGIWIVIFGLLLKWAI